VNIFGNRLSDVDHRFKLLIKVRALALFDRYIYVDTSRFLMIRIVPSCVGYRCTATPLSWLPLECVEHRDLYIELSTLLENTARDIFIQNGWQCNLRIGPRSP
jgi:hypothetical protein